MILKDEAEKCNAKIIERDKTADASEIIKQIKKLLPNVVNSDNALNIQALQDVLDISKTTANNQGYELAFAGKGFAKRNKDISTAKELKAERRQSKNFDSTQNVIIRGDNLDVLKILKQNYKDKIKMIYIDPPYNTQSDEFIYKDNFRENEKSLIEEYDLSDETINYLHNIYGSKTHSGWLSFMYPRLALARDLLRDDGVIFISIDDNEQANLKILCDEIFGEENFIAELSVVDNLKGNNNTSGISSTHEYALIYSKKIEKVVLNDLALLEDEIEDWQEDELGFWKKGRNIKATGENAPRHKRPTMFYPIYLNKELKISLERNDEFNIEVLPITDGEEVCWNWSKEFLSNNKKELIVEKTNEGKYNFFKKQRPTLEDIPSKKAKTTFYNPKYSTSTSSEVIKSIFNGKVVFNYSKSHWLIKDFIQIASKKDSIILDFFAGSGTTAQAVMELNKEDGGNRRFILVQIDEKIKEDKAAYKFCKDNNLEPVISSITIERARRTGEKINEELNAVDTGYKVFSLTDKPRINHRDNQLELVNKRDSAENTLYNMMSANCVELTEKIQVVEKERVYLIKECYYVIAECNMNGIDKTKHIYIDGYSPISLEQWLNMNSGIDNERVGVVY
uniref:site-specific DNA-methyltransferase (adenine-specific) n=1 Tax=Candidatus Endomicrobium sp. MdDo-005 TaxID=1837115 RepID=A0A1C9ZTM6_9BACT|nr:type III modification methylase [Candidatus Endomicrobium sp. MdDo-005]